MCWPGLAAALTAAVGLPIASTGRPFIVGDGSPVELAGGKWGRGRLVPTASGGWRWEPGIAFDGEASGDQDTWSFRRGEMDLRLRLAARMFLVAEGLRVTEAGRTQMLAELAFDGPDRPDSQSRQPLRPRSG